LGLLGTEADVEALLEFVRASAPASADDRPNLHGGARTYAYVAGPAPGLFKVTTPAGKERLFAELQRVAGAPPFAALSYAEATSAHGLGTGVARPGPAHAAPYVRALAEQHPDRELQSAISRALRDGGVR